MPEEGQLIAAGLLAVAVSFAATPLAIAVAGKTDFHDRPIGYKGHAAPTPYLGGAAVVGGFVIAALTIGAELSRLGPLVAGAAVLWVLGTVDDRVSLPPGPRLIVEGAMATGLWVFGLGWSIFEADALNLAASVIWVVGLVNAFNLMDNMDGAAGTVGAVTSVTTAVLALVNGDPALAAVAGGLAGACLGFLPYNLTRPARIFLGDGGSLPIGFVIAGALMAVSADNDVGWPFLLAAVLLAGLPVVDTTMVMISRRRAGVALLSGGLDHMTHRLVTRLGSPRKVAMTLGAVQAVLGAVAIGVVELGRGSTIAAWTVWFVAAAAAVAMLEREGWAPMREQVAESARPAPAPSPRRLPLTVVEGTLIAFIVLACGLSPFLYGFYDVSVWGPIALLTLAGLLGLMIARPAVPRTSAIVAIAGLSGLWLWSLASVGWAESADQAMTEANRLMLYAALFAVFVLLMRDDRVSRVVVGAAGAAIGVFALYLVSRMAFGDGAALFLTSRLNEPLGYVNGQAGYMLLGFWPLVAVAERTERRWLAGLGVAGATLLGGLAVLCQTRAAAPAIALSALVLIAVVPGRTRRLWALLAVAAGVAAALAPLLDVYESTPAGRNPSGEVLQTAAVTLVAAAAAAGAVWIAACSAWSAAGRRRPTMTTTARRVVAAAPVAALAIAGIAALLSASPVDRIEREYKNFTELRSEGGESSRFASGGGNRYDYWRVAVDQFAGQPLRGVGAGNYDRTYFLDRRTDEDIRQPHSIELQVLGELGLVGGVALAMFLLAVLAGFARRARAARADLGERLLAVAAGGAFFVWLLHTSVDWLHVIPGVTGLALAAAAVLVAPWRRSAAPNANPVRRAVVVGCAVVILLGAVLVGRAALAESYRSDAQEMLATDPRGAIQKANYALELNDESLPTYYVKAAAYARLDEYRQARRVLGQAARREPHDFTVWVLLGDLAVRRGDVAQAREDYAHAARLNPRDVGLAGLVDDPRSALP